MVQFYCYDKCSTCKKAENYLKAHNISFEKLDIKSVKITKEEAKNFHIKSKKAINKLFNTSGKLYKELNLKDKLKSLSLAESYELLSSDGMLIKRPILVCDDIVIFGYNESEYEEVFKNALRN